MVPIRDTIPSKNTPIGTWIIILANSVVFVFELMLPDPVLEAFFYFTCRMSMAVPFPKGR
jgi:hypothetical protein